MSPQHREATSNRMLLSGFIALSVAVLILIVLTTLMFLRIQDQAASQAQFRQVEALQAKQLLQGCQRQNVLRLSDNNAHYGDFVVFSFVDKRFLVPTPTETPAQKHITDEFAGALNQAVHDASWTPPTDCQRAVSKQGPNYTSPPSVPFTTRLPPASALPPKGGH